MSVDPDIYRTGRRYFDVLDMSMSGFIEMSLVQFIQTLKPFEPLLDDIESGKVDPAELKVAMRLFMGNATELVGENLAELGRLTKEVNGNLLTDKK